MESYQVKSLLDQEPRAESDSSMALDKLASYLGCGPEKTETAVDTDGALKTASIIEKLGRALESGQAKLDAELRDLFGGDETDDDIKRHNEIEDDFKEQTGQHGA